MLFQNLKQQSNSKGRFFKRIIVSFLTVSLFLVSPAFAEYPDKPINFVVGFGIGGSADRMTRSMSSFLMEELGQPIRVLNKKGASTMIAANYVLKAPADGYTVFASTFNPYLPNTIVNMNAKYSLDDFAFINAQWFDFTLIATHKDSKYNSLVEIFETIKNKPKTVKAAVVQGSGGHTLLRIMFDQYGLSMDNLNLVTYSSGGKARAAISGGQVDFIAISAKGSEGIREFLKPIAVHREEPSEKWDAPTVNDAIKSLGFTVPVIRGSVRGFAVPMAMKQKYPERFKKLTEAIQRTLAKKEVQKFLKGNQIGGVYLGPEKTQQIMMDAFKVYSKYNKVQ